MFPKGLHVPGPKERSITLHSRRSISMECERTLVRPPQLRSFPIHSMRVAARRFVETITLIGPPPIDSGIEDTAVRASSSQLRDLLHPSRDMGHLQLRSAAGLPLR